MALFDRLLRFTPLYQTRVWGGRRLETVLHRTLPDRQPYGESWELVDREREQSVVADGPLAGWTLHRLWTDHREAVFGALLFATLPVVALQAATAGNDIVMTSFVAVVVVFMPVSRSTT